MEIAKLYSDKISEIIQVHWRQLDSGKQGVVSLSGLRLPFSAVSQIKPIPLTFSKKLMHS